MLNKPHAVSFDHKSALLEGEEVNPTRIIQYVVNFFLWSGGRLCVWSHFFRNFLNEGILFIFFLLPHLRPLSMFPDIFCIIVIFGVKQGKLSVHQHSCWANFRRIGAISTRVPHLWRFVNTSWRTLRGLSWRSRAEFATCLTPPLDTIPPGRADCHRPSAYF